DYRRTGAHLRELPPLDAAPVPLELGAPALPARTIDAYVVVPGKLQQQRRPRFGVSWSDERCVRRVGRVRRDRFDTRITGRRKKFRVGPQRTPFRIEPGDEERAREPRNCYDVTDVRACCIAEPLRIMVPHRILRAAYHPA